MRSALYTTDIENAVKIIILPCFRVSSVKYSDAAVTSINDYKAKDFLLFQKRASLSKKIIALSSIDKLKHLPCEKCHPFVGKMKMRPMSLMHALRSQFFSLIVFLAIELFYSS